MQAVKSVNSGGLWGNLHLLFWLSLLPFSTGWMGENHFAQQPMLLYGINLLMAAIAYYMRAQTLIARHGRESSLTQAFGRDVKGKSSLALYIIGIGLPLLEPWLGFAVFAGVVVIWLIPDRRMHQAMGLNDSKWLRCNS